jgi:uncharacterized SAM-binding protein YcdF (DUF218 family)
MESASRITAKRRLTITVLVAVLAAIISGIAYRYMRMGYPHMHIIFYLVMGFSMLILIFLAIWTLGACEKRARLAKILRRCYLFCLAAVVVCFILLQGLIISGAHTEDEQADCIIILGAGLIGEYPSMILATRLNAAVEYIKARDEIPVIVSGGMGEGETITEAEAMFRYLRAHGVNENLIWKEEASTRTEENLAYSMAIIEEHGLDIDNIKVAVVTNDFHLYRAKLIAEKAGLDVIGIAAQTPGLGQRILYYCREAAALASELL